jgi:hypothetical protein
MGRRCLKKINLIDVYWIPQALEVDQAKETGRAMGRRKTSWR